MSSKVLTLVWSARLPQNGRKKDGSAKLVLARLAYFADDDGGSIFPSVRTVAQDCDLGERTVQEALGRLLDLSIIELVREADCAARKPREYRINLSVLKSMAEPSEPIRREVRTGCESRTGSEIRASLARSSRSPDAKFAPKRRSDSSGIDDGDGAHDAPIISAASAPPSPSPVLVPTPLTPNERLALGEKVADLIGAKDNPHWFGDYGRIQMWLLQGADPDLILTTIRGVMSKRREPSPPRTLNYFDEPMARAIASRYAPLPEVSPHVEQRHSAPKNHVSRAPGGDPSLAKRAALAAVANLHGVDCFDAAAE